MSPRGGVISPKHIVVSDAGLGLGTGSTQTEIVSKTEHPFESLTFTVYSVLINGLVVRVCIEL